MDLSKQEYVIAELLTRGRTEKEIANKLFISPKTVNNHTYNIRKKWNARNAVDICRIFILSLDNPKKYFSGLVFLLTELPVKQFLSTMMFLTIQFHIIVDCEDMDLRRPAKARTSVRVSRTGRKNKD